MLERTLATDYFAVHLHLHLHFSTPTSELRCALCQQNTAHEDEVKDNSAASDPPSACESPVEEVPQPLMLVSLLRPQTENLVGVSYWHRVNKGSMASHTA